MTADPHTAVEVLTPAMQWGFAGFAVLLLGVIVGLIWRVIVPMQRSLVSVLEQTNGTIERNTLAIRSLEDRTVELLTLGRNLSDEALKRPCIAGLSRERLMRMADSAGD